MPELDQLPDVLTIPELQKMLRIGRCTAYRLIQSKEIRSIRIGKNIRIPKKFVIEFIKAQCASGDQCTEAASLVEDHHPDRFS